MSLLFPNVPNLPGVPQLNRSPLQAYTQVSVAVATISNLLAGAGLKPIWGIFDANNNQVIQPDSIREFGKRAEFHLSKYPIQQGGFTNFNKVRDPPEFVIKMVKGGSLADRVTFESQCDLVAGSINLYTIITPEKTHLNVNCSGLEIERRNKEDAYFEEVYMHFQTIYQVNANYSTTSATPVTVNAISPTAVPTASQGSVAAQPLTTPIVLGPLQTVGIG